MTEIIIALIGSAGTVILGIITYFKDIKIKKLESEKNNIKTENKELATDAIKELKEYKSLAIDYVFDFNVFNKLISVINNIFSTTHVNRFLVFYGINGSTRMEVVSAIFQMFTENEQFNAIEKYQEITIDETYKDMLIKLERDEMIVYDVNKMEECLLKDYYTAEGVKHSIIKFITRRKITDEKDIVIYCSFSTYKNKPFSNSNLNFIKSKFGIVKDAIKKLTKN